MLQTYQGHFREDVRFYADNREVTIPINQRVIINILDNETPQAIKHTHIPLKERLASFNGEYEFEEWDTGANVGIEV